MYMYVYIYIYIYMYVYIYIYIYICNVYINKYKKRQRGATRAAEKVSEPHTCHILPFQPIL